jgi:hypothetical protein
MTLAEGLSAAETLVDARRLGDLYIASRASYGRRVADAERAGTAAAKAGAHAALDSAQDAYAAFYFEIQHAIDSGRESEALDLNRAVLDLADEAHRVAMVRACRETGRPN